METSYLKSLPLFEALLPALLPPPNTPLIDDDTPLAWFAAAISG